MASNIKRVFSVGPKYHGQGPIKFAWQRKTGTFLATCGVNKVVHIVDRKGELVDHINLPGDCVAMDWDKDGELLAVIQDRSGTIFLWDANTHKTNQLDTNMKELTFLKWSANGMLLAVGNARGNLLIYNRATSKKIPILGKHSAAIISGCWNSDGKLALGSQDRTITISNAEGDTLQQATIKADPSQMVFSAMKSERHSSKENTLSVNMGTKSLYLYNINDPENPIELAFQARYGNIVAYQWYSDGYIMIGFSNGFLVVISTSLKEIGHELFQSRNHKDQLTDIAISTALNKAASCGDNCIKIHDLVDLKDIYAIVTLEEDRGVLDKLRWSDDGQILAVSTKTGFLHSFLTKLPVLGDANLTRIAYLTSLREVSVHDAIEHEVPTKLSIEVEPSFMAVGPYHVACGMNNRIWFYVINQDQPAELIGLKEYMGSVHSISLNSDYAAVVTTEGKLQLHVIEGESESMGNIRSLKTFPERDGGFITCGRLTNDFCIYSTKQGSIHYFLLEDWAFVSEYRHVVGIQKFFVQSNGMKLIFIDDTNNAFVNNPINDDVLAVPMFSGSTAGVLWETGDLDRGLFVTYDEEELVTYIVNSFTVKGAECIRLGATKLPFGFKPLLVNNGMVTCLTQGCKITQIQLSSHELVLDIANLPEGRLRESLQNHLSLGRFKDAWKVATRISDASAWNTIAKAALHRLDVATASRAYRQVGDAAMVLALQKIEMIEDRNHLAGSVMSLLGDYSAAQEFFLSSSAPQAALELRRDLLQWDQALQLANTLAPEEVPIISREFAQQLELKGSYSDALGMYEKGMNGFTKRNGTAQQREEHRKICMAGIIRMTFRMGDTSKAMKYLGDSTEKQLLYDCAVILESTKQFNECAQLYERAGYFDKAAEIYLKNKNYAKVNEMLGHLNSPKILVQFAKAKEAEGDYRGALRAYQKANDNDNAVRILVEHLRDLESAVDIVRRTRSPESAKTIARFFQSLKDYKSTIEFYLMAQLRTEAFSIAQAHDEMAHYAELLSEDASLEDFNNISLFFESKNDYYHAGKYLLLGAEKFPSVNPQYAKALKYFLMCPPTESAPIEAAIEVVGLAKSDKLTHQLIDFLMGETDGMPKEAKYIFKLYMSLGSFKEASRTAIIIAREEQTLGNYRNARDILLDNYKQLRSRSIHIPAEMERTLMLLHSYILVKVLIKVEDHLRGARMLIRIANNISKFPSHVVPILTSTVIECQKAGLKTSALTYASMLMRPEYRQKLDAKYKKKIEGIVRRPEKIVEEEPCSPCPFCKSPVPETRLDCQECKNHLPYCIATGQHMTFGDWTNCPSCHFPAIYPHFRNILDALGACPMCNERVTSQQLIIVKDPASQLKAKKTEDESNAKEEQANNAAVATEE